MMKRTKKVLVAALASIMVLGSATAFTSCEALEGVLGNIPFIGNLFGTQEEEVTLMKLEVTTNPTKMDYVAGEEFDPTGMVISAVYSDGSTKVVEDWTYSPTGALKKGQKVEVSYTEGETTKKITVSIKVTNDVVSLTIKTAPNKTEYMPGEKFDPTGMVLTATYENGDVEDLKVTDIAAEYKTTALTAEDTVITITYSGFEVQQEITFTKGVFLEAEDGLLNGTAPNATSTGSGGNFGMDAGLVEAQAGALSLFEAELRAAKMAELGVEASDPAITEYTASAEYKAAVDAYLASAEYTTDVEHYRASGNVYLGGIGQGDVISFIFNSDKAGTGEIAFRLASAWLWADNGNWTPSEMADVQFNVLCEFYVNGVKYDIPDSVVLEGGKTADGSFNQILWVNWKEVDFSDIAFREGRNDIQLKILDHDLVSPAQPDYSFSANVDCLIVTSDDCTISPYSLYLSEDYKLTGVDMVLEDGVPYLVYTGTGLVYSGYEESEIAAAIQLDLQRNGDWATFLTDGTGRTITLDADGNFTLKVDISSINTEGDYMAHFGLPFNSNGLPADAKVANGVTVATNEDGSNKTFSIGSLVYELVPTDAALWDLIVVKVAPSGDYKFTETAKLVAEGDQVYLVIESTWEGYTKEEALTKCATFVDFQELWVYDTNYGTYEKVEEGENSLKYYINISDLAVNDTNPYFSHLQSGNMTIKVSEDPNDLTVTVNGKTYTLSNNEATDWTGGLTIIRVTEAAA